MTDMLRHEYARDDAIGRLEAIWAHQYDCRHTIEAALNKLQAAVGCTEKDAAHALECVWDTLNDMTYDARMAIEDEIAEHEDAIDLAEEADLQRSVPVRI